MDYTTLYMTVFYFLTYRLAILALGGISIFLGYRLFIKGFDQRAAGGSELSAQAGEYNLTLKNAAPGTFFAAFGAIITTVILMGSPPQLDYTKQDEGTGQQSASTSISIRGRNASAIHDQIWSEDYPAMLQKAKEVVALAPDNPNYLDTLASIFFLHNDYKEAERVEIEALEKAHAAGVKENGIEKLERKLETYRTFAR